MVRAIGSNVFAAKNAHIGGQIVRVPAAILRGICTTRVGYSREAVEVCDYVWLYINSLKTLIHWPGSKHNSFVRIQKYAAGPRPFVKVQDLGNSWKLLQNDAYFPIFDTLQCASYETECSTSIAVGVAGVSKKTFY